MTGPPHDVSHLDRNTPAARMAQTAMSELLTSPPPGTRSAAYQLSLAHVLPWLEGDRSHKPDRSYLLPPVPPALPITTSTLRVPEQEQPQQQHQPSHELPPGWRWDTGGEEISPAGCVYLTAATSGALPRGQHASSGRKHSSGNCGNAGSSASKQRLGANTNFAGRAGSPQASTSHVAHQLQQLTGPHHFNSFPQHSLSSPAVHKLQNPPTAPVAISINGAFPGSYNGGSSSVCEVSPRGSTNTTAPVAIVSSKTYSVHLPGLIPARALRPRGSLSSCSGVGSSSGAGGPGASALLVSGGGSVLGAPTTAGIAVPHIGTPLSSASSHSASQSSWEGSSRGAASSSRRQLALVIRG